jgi:hypothetical protein
MSKAPPSKIARYFRRLAGMERDRAAGARKANDEASARKHEDKAKALDERAKNVKPKKDM